MSLDFRSSFWAESFPRLTRADQPLSRLTTLHVGGKALVLTPRSHGDLREIALAARERGESLRVLGLGANVVVSDRGVDEPVVSTRQLRECRFEGRRVRAGAGTLLQSLVAASARRGLAGLEPLVGIPATVGGAVTMNAGGRYGSTFDRLASVSVMRPDGEIEERRPAALEPAYRRTRLGEGEIIVEATFELEPAAPDAVLGRTQDVLSEKSARQPLDVWSAGCIFKNPAVAGTSAGRLIEESGLKGLSVGDAVVSPKHANFIVNRKCATATDVLTLVGRVRRGVFERTGILLELEVLLWDGEASGLMRAESVLQPT